MTNRRALKLSFVVPLASEAASGNWSRSCELLEMGLRCLLALPFERSDIIIVGHDEPSECVLLDNPQVEFVAAEFSAPDMTLKADELIQSKAEDKGKKIELGTKAAHASGSDWVMFCDADDLVSNKLPQECNFESADAIVLNTGWKWRYGSQELTRCGNFHRICGTSMLVRLTKRNFPSWLGSGSDTVAERGHNVRAEALQNAGSVVQTLNRPLAVYVVDNGCNYYHNPHMSVCGSPLRRLLRAAKTRINSRRVTAELRSEFSLPL
jgi:hypothetical protein